MTGAFGMTRLDNKLVNKRRRWRYFADQGIQAEGKNCPGFPAQAGVEELISTVFGLARPFSRPGQ